jgi:hypothetical protein
MPILAAEAVSGVKSEKAANRRIDFLMRELLPVLTEG